MNPMNTGCSIRERAEIVLAPVTQQQREVLQDSRLLYQLCDRLRIANAANDQEGRVDAVFAIRDCYHALNDHVLSQQPETYGRDVTTLRLEVNASR